MECDKCDIGLRSKLEDDCSFCGKRLWGGGSEPTDGPRSAERVEGQEEVKSGGVAGTRATGGVHGRRELEMALTAASKALDQTCDLLLEKLTTKDQAFILGQVVVHAMSSSKLGTLIATGERSVKNDEPPKTKEIEEVESIQSPEPEAERSVDARDDSARSD